MNAFIFPGQGIQRQGMGKEMYDSFPSVREMYEKANDILKYRITDVMFYGDELTLMETCNTQLAVFLYEIALASIQKIIVPDVVAGHSLGEYAALVICGALTFEDGLYLVYRRSEIAQKVCEEYDTAMGAVIGLPDDYVERRLKEISDETNEKVYLANFNGPGQVVITGTKQGVRISCKILKDEGAKKAVPLAISGSFHSPFMKDAGIELCKYIENTRFNKPLCPVYQCVDALPHTDPDEIKRNLAQHLTHPVLWTPMVHNMVNDGVTEFCEVGTDDTLQKIVMRMYPGLKAGPLLYSL